MIKRLQNCFLLEDGAVFRHLSLVQESVVNTDQGRLLLHNWKGLLRIRMTFKKIRLQRELTYLLVHNSYRGYYHWLLESLPKLLEAEQVSPDLTLLLPASYQEGFYAETLHLLGITRVERLQPNALYQVPQLMLPYATKTMGNYSVAALRELKEVFWGALGISLPTKVSKRLYISRRKATRRKILNELEVEQILTTYGFQIACFEDYSFQEQVRLCADTEVLVSIHGAGLSNMVFLPERATVIEFRKFDDGENYFFTQLAFALQHTYHLVYCAAEDEQKSVQDADLWVDIAALHTMLKQL